MNVTLEYNSNSDRRTRQGERWSHLSDLAFILGGCGFVPLHLFFGLNSIIVLIVVTVFVGGVISACIALRITWNRWSLYGLLANLGGIAGIVYYAIYLSHVLEPLSQIGK